MVKEHKYCALSVNDMHLVVMLIPYIEKEIEKGEKIVTILEDSLEEEVNLLISKVNLEKGKKASLKKINWKETNLLNKRKFNVKNKIVLVKGSYEFINRINLCLENEKKIINCYNLEAFERNSRSILEGHDFILNTTGVKKISEMFHKKVQKNSILTK